jgi:hypothetical protein
LLVGFWLEVVESTICEDKAHKLLLLIFWDVLGDGVVNLNFLFVFVFEEIRVDRFHMEEKV